MPAVIYRVAKMEKLALKIISRYKKRTNENKKFAILLCITCFVIITKALTFDNKEISTLIAILETMLVTYELMKGDVENFILLFLTFCTTSIENSLFSTGNRMTILYNFLNLPFIHRYHLLFLLLIGCLKCWPISPNKKFTININNPAICIFLLWCFELFISGLTYFIDDNCVRTVPGLFRYVVLDAYNSFWMVGIFFIVWQLLIYSKGFEGRLKNLLLIDLAALSISGILLFFCGNVWTLKANWMIYLQCPLAIIFSPVLILVFFSGEKHRVLFFWLGLGAFILQVKVTVGIAGTWWVMMLILGLLFVYRTLSFFEKGHIASQNACFLMTISIVGASCIIQT